MHDLLLLRHAEALDRAPGAGDHARPLSEHGEREAEAVADWLGEQGVKPALALCSNARRARMTAEPLLDRFPDCRVQLESAIYEATPGELIRMIDAAGATPLLLVGHNPGIEQLVALLVSGQSGAARGLPPAGLAWIRLDGAAEPGAGTLHAFWSP